MILMVAVDSPWNLFFPKSKPRSKPPTSPGLFFPLATENSFLLYRKEKSLQAFESDSHIGERGVLLKKLSSRLKPTWLMNSVPTSLDSSVI
jgi:hypothetical protein